MTPQSVLMQASCPFKVAFSVRFVKPSGPSVRFVKPSGLSVRFVKPSGPSVRSDKPSGPLCGLLGDILWPVTGHIQSHSKPHEGPTLHVVPLP